MQKNINTDVKLKLRMLLLILILITQDKIFTVEGRNLPKIHERM